MNTCFVARRHNGIPPPRQQPTGHLPCGDGGTTVAAYERLTLPVLPLRLEFWIEPLPLRIGQFIETPQGLVVIAAREREPRQKQRTLRLKCEAMCLPRPFQTF